MNDYDRFLAKKLQQYEPHGFEPTHLPDYLFPFQTFLADWAIRLGRSAILLDCGMGKSPLALVWAENVRRHMVKALAHRTTVDDSTQSGVATADYLLTFRRDGENPVPVSHEAGFTEYAGVRQPPADVLEFRGWTGDQKLNRYSHWIWRQYASAFWDDIRGNQGDRALDEGGVLPYREARDEEDEKHLHPLQLDVIHRAVQLYSNPGERVFTPFMGVGSEVYEAVRCGRVGMGVELKPSYYRQALKNLAAIEADSYQEQTLFGEAQ